MFSTNLSGKLACFVEIYEVLIIGKFNYQCMLHCCIIGFVFDFSNCAIMLVICNKIISLMLQNEAAWMVCRMFSDPNSLLFYLRRLLCVC